MEKIKTFLADISALYDEKNYQKIYQKVPAFRRQKADRLKQWEDRAQSVGAWYLWMQVQQMLDIDPVEEQSFNLSHSGKYVLCSVDCAGQRVGCDVECMKDYHENLAKRFFCPSEFKRISQAESKKTETFYRYWVLKESFLKATRKGMALGLDTFEILLPPNGTPQLVRWPEEISERYFFKEYQTDGARIAVCSTNQNFEETVQDMTDIY